MNEEEQLENKDKIKELLIKYSQDDYNKKLSEIEEGFFTAQINISASKDELLKRMVYLEIMNNGTEMEKEICEKMEIREIMFSKNETMAHIVFTYEPLSHNMFSYKLHANKLSNNSIFRIYLKKYKVGNEYYMLGVKESMKDLDLKTIINNSNINPFTDDEGETVDVEGISNLLNELGVECKYSSNTINISKNVLKDLKSINLFA